MHLTGDGVTRNFLTILESDARRTKKSLLQVFPVIALIALVAWVTLLDAPSYALFIPAACFAMGLIGAGLLTRFYSIEAYEVSLRDHWNRWMRWSVSCKTVRECYAKVHDQRNGYGWWIASLLLTALLLAHFVFWVLSLNEGSDPLGLLPLYSVDALWLGAVVGRRVVERRWYKRFLASCNDLLRDGHLGLWGVY